MFRAAFALFRREQGECGNYKTMKKNLYDIPANKQIRIFIDTDADCEADDHYAIAHALMTHKCEVRGIMAEHYGGKIPQEMEKSYEEIRKVCLLCGADPSLVFKGAEASMREETDLRNSEGAEALVREAMSGDTRPLFVICQGALTNVAAAILKEPAVCEHMLLVVIGGANYPAGAYEFNTMNDRHAFNVVMQSRVPCWIVPEEVYSTMQVGMCELMDRIAPCGELGKYLTDRTLQTVEIMNQAVPDYSEADPYGYAIGFPNGESWSLGDSCGIGLLISHHSGDYQEVTAPLVLPDGSYDIPKEGKRVRWYSQINGRFVLEDFFSKMEYNFK